MSNNYKQYFAIEKELKAKGHKFTRQEMIENITEGRKHGLKDLTPFEYRELINQLNKLLNFNKPNPNWMKSPENKMRRKVWSYFVRNMKYSQTEFEQWMLKYSKYHKALNEYSIKELTELVTQAESVYTSFIKRIDK